MITLFEGSPTDIGLAYGKAFAQKIHNNVDILLERTNLPAKQQGFIDWVKNQEAIIRNKWPWLLEEIQAVGIGAEIDYENILFLNLRAWQYNRYKGHGQQACTSFAVTCEDGKVVCAGALDDPAELYCGAIHIRPDNGYNFVSFPIAGTSWANRGMNHKGLSMGISSQVSPGLKSPKNAISQDLAMRILLQSCATVAEVREFCKEYPFNVNIVCVDAGGEIFCAHQTNVGLFEISVKGYCAMANHIIDERVIDRLMSCGVNSFPETPTTRQRLKAVEKFLRDYNGKCSAEEVKDFLSRKGKGEDGFVNNEDTYVLTLTCPQENPSAIWVGYPDTSEKPTALEYLSLS